MRSVRLDRSHLKKVVFEFTSTLPERFPPMKLVQVRFQVNTIQAESMPHFFLRHMWALKRL